MRTKTCIVAGALGVAGRAFLEELEGRAEWEIIGLSRRSPEFRTRAHFVAVDLTDAEACARLLAEFKGTTHIYFAAYAPQPTLAEEVALNLAMLVNLVSAIDKISPSLQHVAIVHGSKWYGNHLGPYKTPAREDDARHMPPNFYYDQQDWIEGFQSGKRWTWSSWRPHGLCGLSIGSAMNQLNALALYATISRELGRPLRFPGSAGAFRAVYQFTDASVLARAALWASGEAACANQAFNITNGDYDRWENIWPDLAREFKMDPGPVQTLSLARFMADKEPLWARIRERNGLRPYRLRELVNWEFADWVYSSSFDQMSSLAKIRQAGWNEVLTPLQMFRRLFARMREERIVP
ncbi:MAG: SDR family oxidoreductase [Candidatus Binataceae bacterium]|nr:SDR family oxidoreductase [Candidatus Binataceae bacterium]